MNSHILIPKCIFKEFVNEKEFYYQYDVENKKIVKGFPKSTYTAKDYYSKEIENKLNLNVESQLKSLLHFCEKISASNEVVIEEKIKKIAWTYLNSTIARNPRVCKEISKNTVYFQFMPMQCQHDYAVDQSMEIMGNLGMFNFFEISFLLNETNIPFILPTRGMYEYTLNGVTCFNVPLKPFISLLLVEKGKSVHKENKAPYTYLTIQQNLENVVRNLNRIAFIKQCDDKTGYVVSNDKAILERLAKVSKNM